MAETESITRLKLTTEMKVEKYRDMAAYLNGEKPEIVTEVSERFISMEEAQQLGYNVEYILKEVTDGNNL